MGHTPGPWAIMAQPMRIVGSVTGVVGTNTASIDRDTPTTPLIAGIPHRLDDDTLPPSRLANARLIAAAPELLEACKSLLDEMWRHIGKRDVKKHFHLLVHEEAARAAIAKAVTP